MTAPHDLAALKQLQDHRAGELARVRTRAEKWIPGLAAVTGVLTTAVVVKGAETFTKAPASTQLTIIALMIVGAVAVGTGVFCAYAAAHGNPFGDDELSRRADQQKVDGAYEDWNAAVRAEVSRARRLLTAAVIATLVGTASLGTAVVVTWFAPATGSGATTCLVTDDGFVRIEGTAPVVVDGELRIVPCAAT